MTEEPALSSAVRRLLEEAQKLPPDKQDELIEALISDHEPDEIWSLAWADECKRREASVERGELRSITLDEFKARIGR